MSLEPDARVLIEISAALAARDTAALDAALAEAAEEMHDRIAVEEALLQSYLFLGFPAALTALGRWREIDGVAPGDTDELACPDSVRDWTARGEAVCRRVYGRAYGKLRANVARVHPAMDGWMVTEGYGKVLGRSGLDLRTRELCIVAILAACDWEPQLHSHLRGAMHAGARPDEVEAALEAGLRYADHDVATASRELWSRVVRAHGKESRNVH